MTLELELELERPAWAPRDARLVVQISNELSLRGYVQRGRRRLGTVTWSASGRILAECPLDARGRRHGLEIERHEPGESGWCAQWVHGSMHGPVIQLDAKDRPLVVTQFVRGAGADIWVDRGEVSEYREMVDGDRHGVERWGPANAPWEETYFVRGLRHGPLRRWSATGELQRGYPHFYVKDVRVPRRAYEQARAKDETLRPYRAEEDASRRAVPPAVREALRRAKELRQELAIVERARRAAAASRALGR